jgi:hypothetical protein
MKTLMILVSIFLVSCGDSSSETSGQRSAPFQSRECALTVGQGEWAQFAGAGFVNYLDFNKPIKLQQIYNIKSASAQSTIDYIKREGTADLFVVDTPEGAGCKANGVSFLSSFINAPAWLANIWARKNEASNNIIIQGVYYPKNDEVTRMYTSRPTLSVSEYATKWTIVHEFMHHLFSIEMTGISDENLFNNLEILERDLNVALKNNQYQQAFEYARNAFTYFALYLDRYPLEEFTIEKKLFSMWESKELKYVESFEPGSSLWYANRNVSQALVYLNDYEELVKKFSGNIESVSLNSFVSLIQTKKRSVEEAKAWVNSIEKRYNTKARLEFKQVQHFHAVHDTNEMGEKINGVVQKILSSNY